MASKTTTRSSRSSAPKAAPAKKAAAPAKPKAAPKKATTSKAKATTPRAKFDVLKTQAACEKVMAQHKQAYIDYQVERDKNRNEKGMEKHRLGYRTYKNAYTQLLGIRKAEGLGRRNAKAES